jgi:hypothetical protein
MPCELIPAFTEEGLPCLDEGDLLSAGIIAHQFLLLLDEFIPVKFHWVERNIFT